MEQTKRSEIENRRLIAEVSSVTIAGNVILSVFKLFAGIVAHSGAMISDAIHSASDVLTTLIALVGIRLSKKAPDQEHPYGHERFECVASILLAGLLLATGLGVGYAGVRDILQGTGAGSLAVPGVLALVAAVVSIAVKEWMYWYTRAAAKKLNSTAFLADAWHHRSDALSSVGSLIGIAGARLGLPILDPIASVVICLFILKISVDIFKDAIGRMTDRAGSKDTEQALREFILEQEGVLGVDVLRTRMFGSRLYVDVELSADGSETLEKAHDMAERVHHGIECAFPEVKHIMIHVNPAGESPDGPSEVPESSGAAD